MIIRPATHQDCEALTEISFLSKNHWDYPKEYFEIWKSELTITEDYITNNNVQIIENGVETIGYYSVVELEKDLKISNFIMEQGVWLEHVFIRPDLIGQGYGKILMQHLVESSIKKQWIKLRILVDPHSSNFYKKLGAKYIKEIPSSIPGRTVSYFEWDMEKS